MAISEIAKKLSKNKTTIYREIKRNSSVNGYDPKIAHQKSILRRWHNYMFRWLKFDYFSILFKTYFDKRSSGVWVTYLRIKNLGVDLLMPSLRHVYNLINSWNWVINPRERLRKRYLKRYGIRKKEPLKTDNKFVMPIAFRPEEINKRLRPCDFELDLICGTLTQKHSGYLVILVNRSSRQIYGKYSSSKNDFKIAGIVKEIIVDNNLNVKSITTDRGGEFDKLALLGKWLNLFIYQGDPYRSCQKGSIENANSIIRRFFPSGTNFSKITNEQIQYVFEKINSMPRKLLDGLSANEYAKLNF